MQFPVFRNLSNQPVLEFRSSRELAKQCQIIRLTTKNALLCSQWNSCIAIECSSVSSSSCGDGQHMCWPCWYIILLDMDDIDNCLTFNLCQGHSFSTKRLVEHLGNLSTHRSGFRSHHEVVLLVMKSVWDPGNYLSKWWLHKFACPKKNNSSTPRHASGEASWKMSWSVQTTLSLHLDFQLGRSGLRSAAHPLVVVACGHIPPRIPVQKGQTPWD